MDDQELTIVREFPRKELPPKREKSALLMFTAGLAQSEADRHLEARQEVADLKEIIQDQHRELEAYRELAMNTAKLLRVLNARAGR